MARHVVRASMTELGVDDDCVDSIELALSEACTNVLRHAGPEDQYEVSVDVDVEQALAILRVVDTGRGFDSDSLGNTGQDPSAERGRGLQLMHALVDRMKLTSKPETGTVVHLEKLLEFRPGSPAMRSSPGGVAPA